MKTTPSTRLAVVLAAVFLFGFTIGIERANIAMIEMDAFFLEGVCLGLESGCRPRMTVVSECPDVEMARDRADDLLDRTNALRHRLYLATFSRIDMAPKSLMAWVLFPAFRGTIRYRPSMDRINGKANGFRRRLRSLEKGAGEPATGDAERSEPLGCKATID